MDGKYKYFKYFKINFKSFCDRFYKITVKIKFIQLKFCLKKQLLQGRCSRIHFQIQRKYVFAKCSVKTYSIFYHKIKSNFQKVIDKALLTHILKI